MGAPFFPVQVGAAALNASALTEEAHAPPFRSSLPAVVAKAAFLLQVFTLQINPSE